MKKIRTLPLCALSYGDGKGCRTRRPKSPVRLAGSVPVAPGPEECSLLLPVKPTKELLEARIVLNLLDRVELVAQFVMRPRFMDEILARMAGRGDVASAFAARHNVMPSRGHPVLTQNSECRTQNDSSGHSRFCTPHSKFLIGVAPQRTEPGIRPLGSVPTPSTVRGVAVC